MKYHKGIFIIVLSIGPQIIFYKLLRRKKKSPYREQTPLLSPQLRQSIAVGYKMIFRAMFLAAKLCQKKSEVYCARKIILNRGLGFFFGLRFHSLSRCNLRGHNLSCFWRSGLYGLCGLWAICKLYCL